MSESGFNIARGLMGAGVVCLAIGLILGFIPMEPTWSNLDCGSVFNKTKAGQWVDDGELCDFSGRTTAVTILLIAGGVSLLIGFFGKQKS